MAVHFRVESADVIRALGNLRDNDAPIVTAYALTKTGQDIKAAEIDSMKSVFDRPTKFTLNALYLKPATKTDLVAEVYFKDGFGSLPAWRYLGPQVEGGARVHKSHELRLIRAGLMQAEEFAVPGSGIKLDGFGNVPGSTITRILSQLGAAEQKAGYQANATGSKRSRAKKKKAGTYFVLRPGAGGRADRNVAPGIYFRDGARGMVPAIMFVRAPRYQKRFPFYETARATFDQKLVARAREGWQRFVGDKLKVAA
ncbi:hypothetical protein [Bradyrhizobium sp. Bra78]|uniref:hypothetical protein n=1 Tax=Bradyrhizobium sp. Bra78 TaxID=2926010 RepID=UPI0021C6542D|nr:hypothetical protein [Bradyrhizobium sp. Bra78]